MKRFSVGSATLGNIIAVILVAITLLVLMAQQGSSAPVKAQGSICKPGPGPNGQLHGRGRHHRGQLRIQPRFLGGRDEGDHHLQGRLGRRVYLRQHRLHHGLQQAARCGPRSRRSPVPRTRLTRTATTASRNSRFTERSFRGWETASWLKRATAISM